MYRVIVYDIGTCFNFERRVRIPYAVKNGIECTKEDSEVYFNVHRDEQMPAYILNEEGHVVNSCCLEMLAVVRAIHKQETAEDREFIAKILDDGSLYCSRVRVALLNINNL